MNLLDQDADYDPLPEKSSPDNQIFCYFKQIKSFFQETNFSYKKKGSKLCFGGRELDINSILPHLGIIILMVLVLASSFLAKDRYHNYQALQQSILKPEEIAAMTKSIDKYTPFIKESKINYASYQSTGQLSELITSQGYISQPKAVLASYQSRIYNGLSRKSRDELIDRYTVKSGDSISSIAQKFAINISTLRWANQLSNLDYIRPGQKLIIPKKDGVWHTVRKGQTLSGLVAKYDGNMSSTLKFNGLGKGDKIREFQKVLIVGGAKPLPQVASTVSSASSGYASRQPAFSRPASGSSYNRFPYGWCTWYVASRRNIPWSGNAGAWLYNARAMGYSTGSTPAVGAIIVTNESWVGHVAIVEAVYGNQVKISEMNGRGGWGVVGTRTIPRYSGLIKGYIY